MKRSLTIGIALIGIGAGMLFAGPGIAVPRIVIEAIGPVLGGGLVVLGVALSVHRLHQSEERWDPDAPERGVVVPAPGDDLASEGEPEIGRRFRARVVEALVQRGYDRREAEAAIDRGTWTTDHGAATYLTADQPAGQRWLRRILSRGAGPEEDRSNQRARALEELEELRQHHE